MFCGERNHGRAILFRRLIASVRGEVDPVLKPRDRLGWDI